MDGVWVYTSLFLIERSESGGSFLTPHTKINSKWMKHLNVRPETIKLLTENIGSYLMDISLSNIFLDMSPQPSKSKHKLLEHIKIESFCTTKQQSNLLSGRRYLQMIYPIRD